MGRTFRFTVATIAVGVVACWPTLQSLAVYWENYSMRTYVHGYGVAAISLGLIWRARHSTDATNAEPFWPAMVATAILSGCWYLAWISGVEIGYQVLFPLIVLTAVAAVVGLSAAATVSFGILYLYFAVPIWDYLNEPLRSFTTLGVTAMSRVTGLPAYIEANTVYIPSGAIKILGGCSGLRYFIVALSIAAVYGELERMPFRQRVQLLAVAAGMAILMNWVRVFGIIVDGHLTDMKGQLVAGDHELYGWLLFGLLLVAVFWVGRRFAPAVGPLRAVPPQRSKSSNRLPVAFVAVLPVLAIGPVLASVAGRRSETATAITITLPEGSGDWRGPTAAVAAWSPVYPTADAEVSGEYQYDGTNVSAYVNAYAYQAQGHEVIGLGNNLLGELGWQAEISRSLIASAQGTDIPYVEVTATSPSQERWVIAYVYSVGGRAFTGVIPSKLYYGIAALQGSPWSGVVAAATKCAVDCSAASATVMRFMSDNGVRLLRSIPQR